MTEEITVTMLLKTYENKLKEFNSEVKKLELNNERMQKALTVMVQEKFEQKMCKDAFWKYCNGFTHFDFSSES